MTIKTGDYVKIEYTGKTNGQIFDTNIEKVAKDNNAYNPKMPYQPMLIEVGAKQVIQGLEETLPGMKKDEEKHVEIPAEKAYGQRNPALVKVVPLSLFTQNKMHPVPGMVVNLDNHNARIQSVSGGRVRVDFNHELAGKELEFDFKIIEVITKKEDKIKAVFEQLFPAKTAELEVKSKEVIVKPTAEALITKEYGQAKAYFVAEMQNRFKDMEVEFIEKFSKKE